jgi:hypothetical protein
MKIIMSTKATLECNVDELYQSMDEGEKAHMFAKLWKHKDYNDSHPAIRALRTSVEVETAQLEEIEVLKGDIKYLHMQQKESDREWIILEGACDFWKDTAMELGYED